MAGNVRELENCIQHMVAMNTGRCFTPRIAFQPPELLAAAAFQAVGMAVARLGLCELQFVHVHHN